MPNTLKLFQRIKKNEKQILKFLETLRDSQFTGPHKQALLRALKEKKKHYNYACNRIGKGGWPDVREHERPKEHLKVSITHEYSELL